MIVIVYGYEGSGPGHWQRWLAEQLEKAAIPHALPELPRPSAPDRDAWVGSLAEVVRQSPEPVCLVAHSLGCWAVDHYLARHGADRIEAALLVAPPSPTLDFPPIASFLPPPRNPAAWAPIAARSLVVGSDNDPYAAPDEPEAIAAQLGIPFHPLPGAGHVNVASGFGPLPLALEWARARAPR